MSDDRQSATFRIRPETKARLREMAELTDRTMVSVLEVAIKFLHERLSTDHPTIPRSLAAPRSASKEG